MRAPLTAVLAAGVGCATHHAPRAEDDPVSPRFSELAPRRIAVAVVGEEPRDAQVRIDRFGLTYPPPIRPDTVLPAESDATRRVSVLLSEGVMDLLRARGYEVLALSSAGIRVGDLLLAEAYDAVLVVHYRAANRWPVSEYRGTERGPGVDSQTEAFEVRGHGSPQPESRQFVFMIERGLLILPTATLLDARTSARLWSRTNLGLEDDRVEMASPLRKLGVVVPIEREPPPLSELVPQAVRALVPFYFDSIPATGAARPRPQASREAELREEAAVERFRDRDRWWVDVGGGWARRSFRAESGGTVELPGDEAFGHRWQAEAGVRHLGRRLLHGPRAAFSRDTSDYERLVLDTTGMAPEFRASSLRTSTTIDLAYTLAWTWQPRRDALLAAGAGPALGFSILDGDGLDQEERFLLGLAAEIEGHWRHDWLLVGPFCRGTWMADLSASGHTFALALGLRAGATF